MVPQRAENWNGLFVDCGLYLKSTDVLSITAAVHEARANFPLDEPRRLLPIPTALSALRREVIR